MTSVTEGSNFNNSSTEASVLGFFLEEEDSLVDERVDRRFGGMAMDNQSIQSVDRWLEGWQRRLP